MGDGNKFEWSDVDAVVVPSIRAIAVYTNPSGEIVIRQEGDGEYLFGGQDPFIVIPRDRVKDLIAALEREMGEHE